MLDLAAIWTLVQKELYDARRNRWYLLFAVAFAGLSLALAWLSLTGSGSFGLAGFGRTAASMINLVLLIIPLMGLTIGALSLAGERERGSLVYLLSQPVNQLEILLGKYLGAGIALLAALIFGFGLSGLVIGWQQGAADVVVYLSLILFAFLLALASLSLGFLISASAKKTASAIGVAIFVWLLLVFFGDLGLMGSAIVLRLQVAELFTLAVFNPLQVFKLAAIWNLRSSLEVLGPAGAYASHTFGEALLPVLVAILGLWIALPLAGAFAVFRLRGGL